MLTVKVEVFRPSRVQVDCTTITDVLLATVTMKELVEIVNNKVKSNVPFYKSMYPLATEIRWEFVEYGQGHYIPIN